MERMIRSQGGALKISHDVLATIARVAALEIEGVAGLAEESGGFSLRRLRKKPVEIVLNNDFAEIDMHLSLMMGSCIGDVSAAVQTNVKDNVQTMTGIVVSKVNIYVDEVEFA